MSKSQNLPILIINGTQGHIFQRPVRGSHAVETSDGIRWFVPLSAGEILLKIRAQLLN